MESRFIEFIGNPGSGKSTIANKLAESLLQDNYTVYNINKAILSSGKINKLTKKILYILRLLFVKPYIFFKIIHKIIKSKQPNVKILVKMILNTLYIKSLIDRLDKKNYDFIILDQGMIQAIWSTKLDCKSYFNYVQLINGLPMNYNLVYVEVEDSCLIKRLSLRKENNSRFEKNPQNINFFGSNTTFELLYNNFDNKKVKYNNNNKIDMDSINLLKENFIKESKNSY